MNTPQKNTPVSITHIPAGEPSLTELKAGQTLRLLDLEGNQAVDTLFYSLANPVSVMTCSARCVGRTTSI